MKLVSSSSGENGPRESSSKLVVDSTQEIPPVGDLVAKSNGRRVEAAEGASAGWTQYHLTR